MSQCSGITAAGGRCKGQAIRNSQYCFSHSPDHADARKQRASKGGKRGGRGRGSGEIAELKKQLEDLAKDVLAGNVERGNAVVVNQILNTRARLIELERKVKETDELEARLDALEQAQEQKEGRRWGA